MLLQAKFDPKLDGGEAFQFAIFDWKQCNFHKNAMNSLEDIWLQFLKKKNNRKKIFKTTKMLHYLLTFA